MRLARKQATAGTTGDLATSAPAVGDSVVELRPIDQLRICPHCLVANGLSDSYCTACGRELGASDASAAEAKRPVVVHPPVPAKSLPPLTSPATRSWKMRVALVTSIVLGLAGTTTFGLLWNSEKTHRQHVTAQRDAAQADLSATQTKLAATLASLRSTSALANQRKAVLLRAQTVLAKVDPLLSDADHIKQVATDIQSVRNTFASDSSQMTSDLLYLENYEANPQNFPGVDQYGLVAQVDNELATVRNDYAALTASDGSFSDASTTFGNHATAFTTAVRKLQAELQRATSK